MATANRPSLAFPNMLTSGQDGFPATAAVVHADDAAVDNTIKIPNSGNIALFLDNSQGDSDVTVTVVSQYTVSGLALDDLVVVVPNGERRLVGYFAPYVFSDGNGQLNIRLTRGNPVVLVNSINRNNFWWTAIDAPLQY